MSQEQVEESGAGAGICSCIRQKAALHRTSRVIDEQLHLTIFNKLEMKSGGNMKKLNIHSFRTVQL